MSNVIELNGNNMEQQILDGLNQEIRNLQKIIDEKYTKIKESKELMYDLKGKEVNSKEKTQINKDIKQLDASIKSLKVSVESDEDILDKVKVELSKILGKRRQQNKYESDKQSAEKVFDQNNIHYIAFDQQWWSVDPAGNRMSVKINSSEYGVIKDLIFLDSDREITSEQELKVLAKQMNRMYKHLVRDFSGPRSGIYNQMDTIRKQWLTPIHGVKPDYSFRLLTLAIAGGDEDYADQLEKFVAYRYCHPEDVMIPNIDSCAVGGTGRDTFFNIIRTIFTDECCGSAGEETFKGTHNGDLFGKMFIKVDEKDSHRVPIDKIKELTGSDRYRHRQMNKDARDAERLFSFFFFRNGFTSTAKLAGTGTSGEDRRFEPVIARINLPRYFAQHHGFITDINEIPDESITQAMTIIIKDCQKENYKQETRISEWLGYIIDKFNAREMTELMPLHGKYYTEMLTRQQKGIDGFMPKFMRLFDIGVSTVISIKDVHKLYEIAESQKCTKEWFKNSMMYWLNTQKGWDCEEKQGENVYTYDGCPDNNRRKMAIVQNKLSIPEKKYFCLTDFIDTNNIDDRGNEVGEKINVYSIKDELK